MKIGAKEMKAAYKNVKIDQIEVNRLSSVWLLNIFKLSGLCSPRLSECGVSVRMAHWVMRMTDVWVKSSL